MSTSNTPTNDVLTEARAIGRLQLAIAKSITCGATAAHLINYLTAAIATIRLDQDCPDHPLCVAPLNHEVSQGLGLHGKDIIPILEKIQGSLASRHTPLLSKTVQANALRVGDKVELAGGVATVRAFGMARVGDDLMVELELPDNRRIAYYWQPHREVTVLRRRLFDAMRDGAPVILAVPEDIVDRVRSALPEVEWREVQ
jgi:hypothetical protein